MANKLIDAAHEAVKIAQGDIETISKIRVTPSCGCVFCDIKLAPTYVDDVWIHTDGYYTVPCSNPKVLAHV